MAYFQDKLLLFFSFTFLLLSCDDESKKIDTKTIGWQSAKVEQPPKYIVLTNTMRVPVPNDVTRQQAFVIGRCLEKLKDLSIEIREKDAVIQEYEKKNKEIFENDLKADQVEIDKIDQLIEGLKQKQAKTTKQMALKKNKNKKTPVGSPIPENLSSELNQLKLDDQAIRLSLNKYEMEKEQLINKRAMSKLSSELNSLREEHAELQSKLFNLGNEFPSYAPLQIWSGVKISLALNPEVENTFTGEVQGWIYGNKVDENGQEKTLRIEEPLKIERAEFNPRFYLISIQFEINYTTEDNLAASQKVNLDLIRANEQGSAFIGEMEVDEYLEGSSPTKSYAFIGFSANSSEPIDSHNEVISDEHLHEIQEAS